MKQIKIVKMSIATEADCENLSELAEIQPVN